MSVSPKTRRSASLSIESLSKSFDSRDVLSALNLEVAAGEFVAVVGRSGCGKSTLLRLLSGLEEPTSGHLRVLDADGKDAQEAIRVVFQEPRLLPWKPVLQNVCIGNRDCTEAARRVLNSVGLEDRINDYPAVLSGGQRQRVALARALVHEPSVLLLDEPFGALDALTRIEAQRLVEQLWLEHGFTALLVTHDVGEAVLLADRVVLIEEGRVANVFDVNLPRPRRRETPELVQIAAQVLDAIFGAPKSGPQPELLETRRNSQIRGPASRFAVAR